MAFNARGYGSTSWARPPPAYTPTVRTCFAPTLGGRCTSQPIAQGFCSAHQEYALWLHPAVADITPEERREHAEGRRCCGLTKKYALCNNNPGGNFRFCWRHGGQRPVAGLGPALGSEPPQTTALRELFREFNRIQADSEADAQDARDRWARDEQRRREQERERAERKRQDRQRQREKEERRQQREQEQRQQQEQERARREQQQEDSRGEQWHRSSYQRQRRYKTHNANRSGRQSGEEQQRREQQQQQQQQQREQEQTRRAEAEHQRREQDVEFRTRILQRYVDVSVIFDQTIFSATDPNTFARIPWPVIPLSDGTVNPSDITPENVRRFFDRSKLRFTTRQVTNILKNTARRFHPDRFSVNRAVISSIRDLRERNTVLQAADVVIKTVTVCLSG
ncbi:hypothetical protein B0H19DRAFT_1062709 [Mycena capillaripes]|nr:hypothetical protein B0H19DRAFT_1062709 [Mycena capillaripes]